MSHLCWRLLGAANKAVRVKQAAVCSHVNTCAIVGRPFTCQGARPFLQAIVFMIRVNNELMIQS